MKKSKFLKRLYLDEVIIIPAVDGSKTIFKSEDIFRAWIDSGPEEWDLNRPSKKTPEIKTQVHKMVQNADFKQMFSSLNDNLGKLCLTQHQIAKFCAENHKYLRADGLITFFLVRKKKWWWWSAKYFVVGVSVRSDGLDVSVVRFEHGLVWWAGDAHHIVVPQLEA